MALADIEGQTQAIEVLRAALRGGSVHHAYLFLGPEGVGKETAALGLAQALLCRAKPGEGCGTCDVCGRVKRRNHPDVTLLLPEEESVARGLAGRSDFAGTPSRDIRVEQVRALQERLSLRPLEGSWKVALVGSAERLNVQAQNAFLKTLEEPPKGTVLVLLATSTDRLLPTLRSRCATVLFRPLPVALLAARVQKERKLDPVTAQLVAVMAGGSLSRALAWDVDALQGRADVISAFERLRSREVSELLKFADTFGRSREDAEDALRLVALWLRDVAAVQAGGAPLNQDLAALAQKTAEQVSPFTLHRHHALLEQALEAIGARNGSPRLHLERMLIEMRAP